MFPIDVADVLLANYKRKYKDVTLTVDEMHALSQKEFINYLREQMWDKLSPEIYNKPFEELTEVERQDVDLQALLKIHNALVSAHTETAPESQPEIKS